MPHMTTMRKTSSILMHLAFLLYLSSSVRAAWIGVQKRDTSSSKRLDIPIQYGSSGKYAMAVNMATGDNTQRFNFTFSLGSGLTYAAGTTCQSCSGVSLYNQADSTTARSLSASGSGSFLTGSVSGALIKETCAMKAINGTVWPYTNQTVLVVNDQAASPGVPTDLLGANSGVSGIVGLGTNIAASPSAPSGSAVANVSSGNLGLADSIYGQFFNRNPNASNFTFGMQLKSPILTPTNISSTNSTPLIPPGTSAGVFHWLQPDPNAYDTNNVTTKTTINSASSGNLGASGGDWTIALDGWVLNSGSTGLKNSRSVIASLEPMYEDIYFPLDQAILLHAAIPGSRVATGVSSLGNASQAWSIPCNTQFTFGFVVGSQTFTLNSAALVIPLSNGVCVSAIEGWTDIGISQYLLGARFISSIYLIFTIDKNGQQTVGFAPVVTTSNNSSKSNVGAIVGGVIGGVALLLIAVGLGIFFWKRYHTSSSLRATQGQFDPDLTAGDKPEGPTAIPYTLGAPSSVTNGSTMNGSTMNGSSMSPVNSPNTQTSFTQAQLSVSPGPLDPLLTADHPDVLPPAYEASESTFSGGGSSSANNRPRDVKTHIRNASVGSAGPS